MPARDMIPFLGLVDPVSSMFHIVALLAFLLAAPTLLAGTARDPVQRKGVTRYLLACSTMFLCSSTYHGLPHGEARRWFWHLDHATIWLAIAGCQGATQAMFVTQWPGARTWRHTLWTLALVGAGLELTVLHLLPPYVSPLLYVAIGWCGLPMAIALWRSGHRGPFWLTFGGGVLATLGGLCDATSWPTIVPRVFEGHEGTHFFTGIAGVMWLFPIWRTARAQVGLVGDSPSSVAEPVLVRVE